ncbi:MAG: XdhC /CoxI family-like protein [Proteobacteria bacterium]|nr:XdhC /CoxI family-like protein [Pseudomonadota bacterium]
MVAAEVGDLIAAMTRRAEPFALATVVRTVSATAAKPGAKAVILPDGTVGAGWIGGGCARGAVLRAARAAMADGRPRLISVQPEDVLQAQSVAAGEVREGIEFARNACASRGTMDVFVEPVLPPPRLVVWGASPVAAALSRLAPEFGFAVAAGSVSERPGDYIVVSTQGRGDAEALKAALAAEAGYTAFVGSTAKVAALKSALLTEGVPASRLERLRGPAGLDIGAVTPEEIALSIIAEMVRERRRPVLRDRLAGEGMSD